MKKNRHKHPEAIEETTDSEPEYIPLFDLNHGKLPDLFRDFDEAMKHKQLPEIKKRKTA